MSKDCKILSVYSMKGGVGKTTVAVNLAYVAAQNNIKTLLIDLDSQGSASFYFRVKSTKKLTSKKIIGTKKIIEKEIKESDFTNLDVLPSDISFGKLDIYLDKQKKSKHFIGDLFKPLQTEYELIIIDSPPNLTLLTQNIFNASDIVLVPVIPTVLSLLSYKKLFRFFRNKKADLSKFLACFTMVEKRKTMHNQLMEEKFKTDFYFLKQYIPYLSEIEKMGITRKPVIATQPESTASLSFLNLWDEIYKYLN